MKPFLFLLFVFFNAGTLQAQAPEGIWQGYDGEWKHVSKQLVALAEATPAEKYSWRPAPGVRSTSEVYMHLAIANFYLLSVTGPKMPRELNGDMEKTVTSKTGWSPGLNGRWKRSKRLGRQPRPRIWNAK
jgi:hypothetical protein